MRITAKIAGKAWKCACTKKQHLTWAFLFSLSFYGPFLELLFLFECTPKFCSKMACSNVVRRLLAKTPRTVKPPLSFCYSTSRSRSFLLSPPLILPEPSTYCSTATPYLSRSFCSSGPSGPHDTPSLGPVAVDYRHVFPSFNIELSWFFYYNFN